MNVYAYDDVVLMNNCGNLSPPPFPHTLLSIGADVGFLTGRANVGL